MSCSSCSCNASSSSAASTTSCYCTKEVGKAETLEYRMYFLLNDQPISPFHDIPLYSDKSKGILNMVLEIPKGTQAKMEICKGESFNPIKQDVKNGKLRNVAYKYPFNYGAFPQTWENPQYVHPDTNSKGDDDPVDAVDISSLQGKRGEVVQVKVLGTYAMIDEGETDWKILCIDVRDPLASKINDSSDIEKQMPGKLKEVFEFLRDYKIPDGKPANKFAFDNALKDKAFALKVVEETEADWSRLFKGTTASKIATFSTVTDGPNKLSKVDALSKIKW